MSHSSSIKCHRYFVCELKRWQPCPYDVHCSAMCDSAGMSATVCFTCWPSWSTAADHIYWKLEEKNIFQGRQVPGGGMCLHHAALVLSLYQTHRFPPGQTHTWKNTHGMQPYSCIMFLFCQSARVCLCATLWVHTRVWSGKTQLTATLEAGSGRCEPDTETHMVQLTFARQAHNCLQSTANSNGKTDKYIH